MGPSVRLQLLTCLIVYVSSVHGIMVKYGTRKGPILPPAPEPELPPSLPYRAPAPVWEERSNDKPDPNANWKPQHFHIHPRYTKIVYSIPVVPPLSNAQKFVNTYKPKYELVKEEPIRNYFNPSQVLSSQSVPGFGLRYFLPNYINGSEDRVEDKNEETSFNDIENNEVDEPNHNSSNDFNWKYEKDLVRRNVRNSPEVTSDIPIYVWPAYVAPVHH